jgi:hypothetical protein
MHWDTKSNPTKLHRSDDTLVTSLQLHYGQFVLPTVKHNETHRGEAYSAYKTKRPRPADAATWHRRLGHPGPSALEHVVQQAEGVKIIGLTTVQCDACGQAKAKRQIRRTPRTNNEGPGERVAIDFHPFEDSDETDVRSTMLITDRYSGFIWDYYLPDRTGGTLLRILKQFVAFLERQFKVKLKVIESDNEMFHHDKKTASHKWCDAQGISLELSAPNTQAQNGGAERSGAVIKEKARANRLSAELPRDLWPEVVAATVYLHNRTPNYQNGWKSPYEKLHTSIGYQNGTAIGPRKPNLSHIRAYGCKAFAMTDDTQLGKFRLQRLDPKAWVGYLVGYRSTNIYRIWIPTLGKTISTRDVIFDERTTYDGKKDDIEESLLHRTTTEIAKWAKSAALKPPRENPELQSFYEDEPLEDMFIDDSSSDTMNHSESKFKDAGTNTHPTNTSTNTSTNTNTYLTPPNTPSPPAALLTQLFNELRLEKSSSQPTAKTIPWRAAYMAGTQAAPIGTFDGKPFDKAKLQRMLSQGVKVHLRDLPKPPTHFEDLQSHLMGTQFKEAEESHLQSHREMQSWVEVPAAPVRNSGQQVLDCMWVYTYKLDKHHHLNKCKARLVVRGDQQRNITSQDTYAATLASRSFRLLMALASKHNLNLKQWDITNAFVHATIDRDVYMRMPRGYQVPGRLLKVQKALYGLRISPLLWQKKFTATLSAQGFTVVPHEPCCMIKDGIFVFFYVDDIIFAYDPTKETEYQHTVKQLQQCFTMTGGEDLQWFLGMEIIRDRENRLIHLSQQAYIDKIYRLANDKSVRHDTPMSGIELKPYEGSASPSEINRYQRKIGSLLFAATTTRPDVSFAVSRLARFLANPSPEHNQASDRVLLYLHDTRNKSLRMGGGEGLEVASDASFADNTIDRKSSQGYAIKLFGGLIAWKANKQDTVTTSTTEAELLALAQVAKEALYINRLIIELGVKLSPTIPIQCDNQQTIRLVTEEIAKLYTKLRHVDIHNHWLRQAVNRSEITVIYCPTSEMIADGLTKALPANKWTLFLEQLGLEPAEHYQTKKAHDLSEIETQLSDLLPA